MTATASTARRLALGALLIALAALAAHAGDGVAPGPGPRLWLPDKSFTFGEVGHGSTVTVPIPVENRGDAPLEIRQIKPSCGCTVARFPERIAPGGKATIELVFDSSKRPPGHQSFRIAIYSNDPSQRDLGAECTLIGLAGEVRTLFRLAPVGAFFGEYVRGTAPEAKTVEVRGVAEAGKGFTLRLASPLPDYLKVAIEQVAPAHARLRFELLPHVPLGELDQNIVFETGVAAQPRVSVLVNGLVNERITGPTGVYFGSIDRARGDAREVALERRDGKQGIPVAKLAYDERLLEVTLQPVSSQRLELTVRVRPDGPVGPFATLIRFLLDDPDQPIATLPVYGVIAGRVQVEPATLLLPAAPGAEGALGALTVRIAGPGALVSAEVEGADDAGVEVTRDGGRLILRGERVPRGGQLVLRTDVPGEERVVVPLVPR
jgi:hypothetical protein